MRTYSNSIVIKFDTVSTGNSGAGKFVTVLDAGTNDKADLFNVIFQSIDNPVQADNNGNYTFTVEDGTYDIAIDYGLPTQVITRDVQIVDSSGSAALIPDLSLAYEFDNIADIKISDIIFPPGKTLVSKGQVTLNDGLGVEFEVVVSATISGDDIFILADGKYAVTKTGQVRLGEKPQIFNGVFWEVIVLENQEQEPEMIAHRGFRSLSMENTMLALTSALSRGADSLEFDVQISLDGIGVLIHNTTVDSVTDGTGAVKDLTAAQLQALSFTALATTPYFNERIPLFTDLLDYAKSNGAYIYPEIKGYRTQADIDIMITDIQNAGLEESCLLQSFIFSDLEYVRAATNITVGFLGGTLGGGVPDESVLDDLVALGNALLLWRYEEIIANPAFVDLANSKGVEIGVYTVNDFPAAQELIELGITKIMSDYNVLGGAS